MKFRFLVIFGASMLGAALSVFACSNGSGEVNDAGPDVTDANADAPLDAGSPHCFVDGGGSADPAASPAFGSFTGSASGDLCLGGAFAVVQQDPDAGSIFAIELSDFGDPNRFFNFQTPIGAVNGSLVITAGLSSAATGNYSSDGACGSLEFCGIMPSQVVDCGDAAAPATCPAGCDFVEPGGPCGPVPPQECFLASGNSDCEGTASTPLGSWQLRLDSLTPFVDDASAEKELTPHGVFRGTLISDDAGASTITIGF